MFINGLIISYLVKFTYELYQRECTNDGCTLSAWTSQIIFLLFMLSILFKLKVSESRCRDLTQLAVGCAVGVGFSLIAPRLATGY